MSDMFVFNAFMVILTSKACCLSFNIISPENIGKGEIAYNLQVTDSKTDETLLT